MPGSDHADLASWLERAGSRLGLVFADMVDSTGLVNSRGTEVYGRIVDAYKSRAIRLASDFCGRVLSSEGDEIFAAFPSAASAYRFARGFFDDAGDALVKARVGVHFGPVTLHHNHDLIGRMVPFAARVMKHAEDRHELWVSDAAKNAVDAEARALADTIAWITVEECVLRGIPNPQRLWRAG